MCTAPLCVPMTYLVGCVLLIHNIHDLWCNCRNLKNRHSPRYAYTRAHMHMHGCRHASIHTRARARLWVGACLHACNTCTCSCTHMNTCMRTRTRTRTQIIFARTCTRVGGCVPACVQHVHAQAHTYEPAPAHAHRIGLLVLLPW